MESRVVQPNPGPDPAAGAATAIETRSLTKRFGDLAALDDLDLVVPRNSIFGFLGPNGAGKTTTIKLLLGLARPTAGTASLFGLDVVGDSLAIRAKVGYLAQEPRFYDHMTARETLEFTARFFFKGPRAALSDRIDDTLELVGLADKAERPIKGFSGGERQRLGLAQAQINHPDLLILDEPAASLDPVGRRDVLDVMARLKAHATIFYSTHILDDVQRVSDRVAILDGGRLVTAASTKDLLRGDAIVYRVTVRGDEAALASALRTQSWVSDARVTDTDGERALLVTVTDAATAEAQLIDSVVAAGGTVTGFGRKTSNLEDVFLQLVGRQDA